MFGISYNTWKTVCEMYFSLKQGQKKAYLQWFPFSKLNKEDKELLISESFYKNYIKSGAFIDFKNSLFYCENYMQKSDGSFRDASLVSPLLFLILQCIGKEIYNKYQQIRPSEIEVYYSGNYQENRPNYKVEYNNFFKSINAYSEQYDYFIKTDVSSFYPSIDMDILFSEIDKICNESCVQIKQIELNLYKQLLSFCGGGKFPLIENSVATSYLATIVYLDKIDSRLYKFLSNKIKNFEDFKIIRYVDDMYILFKSSKSLKQLNGCYNQIRNEYSSILKEYGLALNTKKCCLKPITEINQELKKSLYDEYVNGEKHEIEDLFDNELDLFLEAILDKLKNEYLDLEKYNDLINLYFNKEGIIFTPNEIYNYYVYENSIKLQEPRIRELLHKIVKYDISVLSLDPKRLTIVVIRTKDDSLIKNFLCELFDRNRSKLWNSYDTMIALSYLLQSEFKHIDLLRVLKENCESLYEYYDNNCSVSFLRSFNCKYTNNLVKVINSDWKAYYLFFMYRVEQSRNNIFNAYAYYKNYFDRVSADLDFFANTDKRLKKPNYKGFYNESSFNKLYENIANHKEIIKKAHELRNANPICHASAELVDKESTTDDILSSIIELNTLLSKKLKSIL